MRRGSWPGILPAAILTVAVLLVWTAWVVHRVSLPTSTGSLSALEVLQERDRGCLYDDHRRSFEAERLTF